MGWTLAARGPFGLSTTSNLTLSPSLRVRKPSDRISEWWTKTSGPPSRDRKPKPLDSLNHFTVPSIMNVQASFAFCLALRHLRAHDGVRPNATTVLSERQSNDTSLVRGKASKPPKNLSRVSPQPYLKPFKI